MEFTHLGIKLSVGDTEIRRILLERLAAKPEDTAAARPCAPPRIGEHWDEQGGVYAGIVRGRDGAPDTYLIIGPAHDAEVSWEDGLSYAKGLRILGFTDWHLFYRPEGAVAYANVPELFEGKTHWTCEQRAEYPSSAWGQTFSNGFQHYWVKYLKLRARAVRSVIIY